MPWRFFLGLRGGDVTEVPRNPGRAVEFIIENAPLHAKAKAQRVYIENFLRSKKAMLMTGSDAKTVADREAYAYAHADYIQLLEGLRVAVEEEETLKYMLKAAEARIELYRTDSANNRATDRATQ